MLRFGANVFKGSYCFEISVQLKIRLLFLMKIVINIFACGAKLHLHNFHTFCCFYLVNRPKTGQNGPKFFRLRRQMSRFVCPSSYFLKFSSQSFSKFLFFENVLPILNLLVLADGGVLNSISVVVCYHRFWETLEK